MDKIEEDNIDLLDEVYTMCIVSKEDALEEIADLARYYIFVTTLLSNRFSQNRHISCALSYFDDLIGEFLAEVEFELSVYNSISNYFDSFENLTDCNDTEILEDLKDILIEFDDKVDLRFLEAHNILEYYTDIISSGILTDKNYFHRGLSQKTSKERQQVILSKIPEVK